MSVKAFTQKLWRGGGGGAGGGALPAIIGMHERM